MDLVKYVERKRKLVEKLEQELGPRASQVRGDHHARRPPRPCGMTVHTGVGCPMACIYCYIYDMGFPAKVKPYPLTGREMLYALAVNPYFAPGPGGTMIAMGAVSEPFLPETRDRTLEYLREFGTIRNPVQISTKLTLDDETILKIAEHVPHISFLMTIVALRDYRKLEPKAPPPEERIETCKRLVNVGIHVSAFIRPIIPGFTDRDAEDILNLCKSAGIRTVVLGTLRVTRRIFENLRRIGIDLSNRVRKLSTTEQVPIRGSDLKENIAKLAEKLGFRVYEAACGANVEAAGLGCVACEWGPCGDINKVPDVSEKDIVELARELGFEVSVRLRNRDREALVEVYRGRDTKLLQVWLKELTRRKVVVRLLGR